MCTDCKCKDCMFTMPQGDSSDCHNCDLCIDGDCKKSECEGFES